MIRVCRLVGETWTDVSDHVVGVSGLQRKFNYDRSVVVPAPKFTIYGVELEKGDLLDVTLDGSSIFRLEVAESPVYDCDDGTWTVETVDLLDRLRARYVREIVTSGPRCWWSGLFNPDVTDYRYSGSAYHWDESYFRALFVLRVAVRYLTGIDLDTTAIDDLPSGFVFRHEQGYDHSIPYSHLHLQFQQMRQIGVTEPGKLFYETATWFDVLNAILTAFRCFLTYADGQYRILPAVNTQDVHPDDVFDYSASGSELFDFVRLSSTYVPVATIYGTAGGGEAWTDDSPVESSVTDIDAETYDDYVAQGLVNAKTLSLPNNLVLYRLKNYTSEIVEIQRDDSGVLRPGAVDWMTQLARLRAADYVTAHGIEELETFVEAFDPTQYASSTLDPKNSILKAQRVLA